MRPARRLALGLGIAALTLVTAPRAATLVPAEPGALAAALASCAAGDTLLLASGTHTGPARVDRPIVLRGEPGAVIAGDGTGTVVVIGSDRVTIEDLEVRDSGRRVITTDAGIQVIRSIGVHLRRIRLHDVLYGVYGERCDSLVVEDCELVGRVAARHDDGEGNGIHLWYTKDVVLRGNRERHFADGVYLSFADRIRVEGNVLESNGRYGLHTMYCQENTLVGNHFVGNVAGCAIMFSNHLQVAHNDFRRNRGPRAYGLLLRDCSDGDFFDNRLIDNTIAVFFDGSNRNRFHDNLLADNGWGLFIFASSARNDVFSNSFIHCDYPVALDMRYTTNRFDDGRVGNYWSDNTPYDLDGDGTSDVPYSPVSTFAFLSKQYPDLSVLARSPAVAALSVAERVLPALRPSEAVDHFPRLVPARVQGAGDLPAPSGDAARAGGRVAAFGSLLAFGLGGMWFARRFA
ncbi:MAG: nitrous oxide reductase family maturation protein NosD [Candidatus Eisenbacteria bacterium]